MPFHIFPQRSRNVHRSNNRRLSSHRKQQKVRGYNTKHSEIKIHSKRDGSAKYIPWMDFKTRNKWPYSCRAAKDVSKELSNSTDSERIDTSDPTSESCRVRWQQEMPTIRYVRQKEIYGNNGDIRYLADCSRLETEFAAPRLAIHTARPRHQHKELRTDILKYRQGAIDHGIHFTGTGDSDIISYAVAGWAKSEDRKSTSDTIHVAFRASIICFTKKEAFVALRTARRSM